MLRPFTAGTLSATTDTTDAVGQALVLYVPGTLTLGGTAGACTVTADAAGLPPITFTVTGI